MSRWWWLPFDSAGPEDRSESPDYCSVPDRASQSAGCAPVAAGRLHRAAIARWHDLVEPRKISDGATINPTFMKKVSMKVIIPLAGLGTRLRPHTYTKPKPLINVAGKPMLAHILDKFRSLDVEEYIFIVGYLGDQIEKYVSEEYKGFKAKYVVQDEMLGQAHALWLCRELVDGPVF